MGIVGRTEGIFEPGSHNTHSFHMMSTFVQEAGFSFAPRIGPPMPATNLAGTRIHKLPTLFPDYSHHVHTWIVREDHAV